MATLSVVTGFLFIALGFYMSHHQTQETIKEIKFGNYHEILAENIKKKYPPLNKLDANTIASELTPKEVDILFYYIDIEDGKKGYMSSDNDPKRDAERKLNEKGLIYSHWWFAAVDNVTGVPLDRSGPTPWGRQVAKLFTRIEEE